VSRGIYNSTIDLTEQTTATLNYSASGINVIDIVSLCYTDD